MTIETRICEPNSVNSLAEVYEIIDCSIASRTNAVGAGEYSAMVIYKVK